MNSPAAVSSPINTWQSSPPLYTPFVTPPVYRHRSPLTVGCSCPRTECKQASRLGEAASNCRVYASSVRNRSKHDSAVSGCANHSPTVGKGLLLKHNQRTATRTGYGKFIEAARVARSTSWDARSACRGTALVRVAPPDQQPAGAVGIARGSVVAGQATSSTRSWKLPSNRDRAGLQKGEEGDPGQQQASRLIH